MKKYLSVLLALAMVLSLAACGSAPAPAAAPTEAPTEPQILAYTYEFDGMMGKETARIDLYPDYTCRFYLPGNEMIKDVYEGIYSREENVVTIFGLKNTDENSAYMLPGLWDWIVEGNATVTVDDAAMTFVPEGADAPAEAPAETEGLKNIAYASNSKAQVCDIYLPEGVEKAPVIVLVHGGGFMFGDQGMHVILPVIDKALENGYAVVSVDYRKATEAVFPAALGDVKAAVRFVKAHAMEYGFDPERIAI